MNTNKYYFVTCERGHCGTGHSTEIKFAIAAKNLMEAYEIARKQPSVKHSRFPIAGHEITEQEYNEYKKISAYRRYEQHSAEKRQWYGDRTPKKKNNKRRRG